MEQTISCGDMIIAVLYCLSSTWAIDRFCIKHFDTPPFKRRLFVILLFTGLLCTDVMALWYLIPHIVFALLSHIIIIGLILLSFRADIGKKLLAASVLIAVITMLGNFCDSFLCALALSFLHTINGIEEPFLADWHAYLISCVHIAAVSLTIGGMSERFISVFRDKTRKWYITSAIPLLALIAVIDIADWGASRGIMVISRENMGLYYDQLFSHAEMGILAALSMFAAGAYLFGMDKIYLEQRKNIQYQSQITAYKMLEEQHRESERLRHDMRNHIIALSGLLESKEYEKMSEYLGQIDRVGNPGDSVENTGSKAVDAILYHKRTHAGQSNIFWECDVQIPKDCSINEFDLCVLFGNLLDNAVEACERLNNGTERFVHIQAKPAKKLFLLEVRNSTDMPDTSETEYAPAKIPGTKHEYADMLKRLHTHKEKPEEHGIGLLNVSDVVRSYDGVMNISTENGTFTISILIPINNS